MEDIDVIRSGEFGGFASREAQVVNATARGLGSYATLTEILEFDQSRRDVINAERYGYPAGTPSSQIGEDLAAKSILNRM